MSEAIETATWSFGLFGGLFATFGIAALCLAAVGVSLYSGLNASTNSTRVARQAGTMQATSPATPSVNAMAR